MLSGEEVCLSRDPICGKSPSQPFSRELADAGRVVKLLLCAVAPLVFLGVAVTCSGAKRHPLLLCFPGGVCWHSPAAAHAASVPGECVHANRSIFLRNIISQL